MECAICYGDIGPFRRLACSHAFCAGCIKEWYHKGTGTGCPMCRRPIYFKGFRAMRDKWDEDSMDIKCSEVLIARFDTQIEDGFEMAKMISKKYRREILDGIMEDIKVVEKMYRFLRFDGCTPDEIDYLINDTDYYFSDRNIDKYIWDDDPVKEKATLYPKRKWTV
jgi:hypothetical protein